jgi:hypothetical protein
VLTHEGNCMVGWDPVDDGEAGQSRSRPSKATTAGDLDALTLGPIPCLDQNLPGLGTVAGQPEIRPA